MYLNFLELLRTDYNTKILDVILEGYLIILKDQY